MYRGELEEKLFDDNAEDIAKEHFDFIVVGSGMGGGTVARKLIEQDKKVLVLERGGLLWTTHVLNTSRPHSKGLKNPSPESWSEPTQDNDFLYKKFKKEYSVPYGASAYAGGPVYCLGGRSAVWGLYSPKLTDYDTKHFDKKVIDELNALDDEISELLYNEDKKEREATKLEEREATKLEEQQAAKLEKLLGVKLHPACLAAEFRNDAPYTFPQGAYSTIDFLLNYVYNHKQGFMKASPAQHNPQLCKESHVLLHMQALRFVSTGNKIISIEAKDLRYGDKVYRFQADHFVLAAGTVESYRIAYQSGFTKDTATGITDHALLYYYFATSHTYFKPPVLPNRAFKAQWYTNLGGLNCLVNIAVNCDVFLGRGYQEVSSVIKKDQIKRKALDKLSAIVIEFSAPLNDSNHVEIAGELTSVTMNEQHLEDSVIIEATKLVEKVVPSLGKTLEQVADKKSIPNYTPKRASLGSVAHEVGTLRMGTSSNDSKVDLNLKFHSFSNVYACDLSVFPISPAANPSRTLIGLALRLAKHLIKK